MKHSILKFSYIGLLSFLFMQTSVAASELIIPNQFTSGTRAVAADVNANFDATSTAVNDNHLEITTLLAQITTLANNIEDLTSKVDSLQVENEELRVEIDTLQASVDILETDSVSGLSAVLSITTDRQDNPAAIFSGVNLHVNNGRPTSGTVNGLGNLIIGKDENPQSAIEMCSIGEFDNQIDCEANNGLWSNIHKSGSHNLVIGPRNNYSQSGGIVAGQSNNILARSSSIVGGSGNTASGDVSSISGGRLNIASGVTSSITGGQGNTTSGVVSSISGGSNNITSGFGASISAGNSNIADGLLSSVSGGLQNIADGRESSVSGGFRNTASGTNSSVSGGSSREATNQSNWSAGSLSESF